MTILQKIIDHKRKEVHALPDVFPARETPIIPFLPTLQQNTLALITEIKRASPSKGIINEHVNPVQQALSYENAGASAISVLTDFTFFKGTMDDLRQVKQAVTIPVLNKDFIIHKKQIDYAYASGADIILLIVAALDDPTLKQLYEYASSLQLHIIVEVHNADELQRAEAIHAQIIGINHRNLHDFSVDITRSETLRSKAKSDAYFIAESGIQNREDATYLANVGVDGLLVGESLMQANRTEDSVKSLRVTKC